MPLNPVSEYFKAHYFLGIDGEKIFDAQDKKYASLFIIKGIKKQK